MTSLTQNRRTIKVTFRLANGDNRPGILWMTFGREVNISCSSNSTPKGTQRQFPSSLCVPCIAGSCGGLFLLIVVVILIVCIVAKRKRKRLITSTTAESPFIPEPQIPAPESESHPYNEAYELCTLQPQPNHPDYDEALSASSDATDVSSSVTRHRNQAQPLVTINGNGCTHSVTEESGGDYHDLERKAHRNVLVENTYDHAD
ncbi:hypothetical protein V1264_016141 [Littorina saxatilis]|uniref:Uncharacterized protein n=2 Tax=Littorina saxatilis TaxID=31220 RepID=A0AAN9GIU8_9CAEN